MKKRIISLIAFMVVVIIVAGVGIFCGAQVTRFRKDDLNIGVLAANPNLYTVYGPLEQQKEKDKALLVSEINLLERTPNDWSKVYELRFRIAYVQMFTREDYLKDTTVLITDSEGNEVKTGALLLYTVEGSAERAPEDEEIPGTYNWLEKNSVEVHYLLEEDFLKTYSGQELTATICCTENVDEPLNTKESYAYAVFKIRIPEVDSAIKDVR